ncbi:helix-turn-helix transcriptional regulator [Bradyrhizobium diazoefficiens]
MKALRVFKGEADLDGAGAVLAIGRPAFPHVLMSTLRGVAGVDHCMVFSFAGEGSASCLLNVGDIRIGADLGEAYSEHFHQSDPNKEAIFTHQASASPIMLPSFSRRMYSNSYWRMFFKGSDIVDKFATAVWFENTCFYVNFYKISSRGCFKPAQTDSLRRIAPSISAAVARHFEPTPVQRQNPRQSLDELFAFSDAFNFLTGREKEVCLRILLGYSSEAISSDLGIGIHSTLTYRRRAYDKLGISSQNELFKIVLELLIQSSPKAGALRDLN